MVNNSLKRRNDEDEMKKQNRLPPGQSLTNGFPILTYGANPAFDPDTWYFEVFGELENPTKWSWEEFQKLPTVEITTDIHCVTRWSMFDSVWEGVQFKHIAELVGMRATTKHIIAHCDGGYTTNVALEDMMQDKVLLAYKYDHKPLETGHGAPVRTLIPHLYFWKSAKFVRALEFSKVDKPGFWEVNGYHNRGDPFKEERFGR